MKVQDVKKECLATTGLSVELSNSEIGSIDKLLWTVDNAVETGVNQIIETAKAAGKQYDFEDEIPVSIDLRSLKKVQWLLSQLTRTNHSDLFNEANREFEVEVSVINDAVSKETKK